MYAREKNIKVDIADLILNFIMEPREILVLSCFLTRIFDHFSIELFGEDKQVCKEAFRKTTYRRIFLPKDSSTEFVAESETTEEERSGLKKYFRGKLPCVKKRKRMGKESDEEEVSEKKHVGKGSRLKKIESILLKVTTFVNFLKK